MEKLMFFSKKKQSDKLKLMNGKSTKKAKDIIRNFAQQKKNQ